MNRRTCAVLFWCFSQSLLLKFKQLNCPDKLIHLSGHTANEAYYFDTEVGNMVSNTYYMNELPQWFNTYKGKSKVDSFLSNNWNMSQPISNYLFKDTSSHAYFENPFGTGARFPYKTEKWVGYQFGYLKFLSMPYSDDFVLGLAKAAITGENLGKTVAPDMICVSLTAGAFIGNAFGPNSIEIEDNYIKLDHSIADFLKFLDNHVGKDEYLIFFTSTGGQDYPSEQLSQNRIPSPVAQSNLIFQSLEDSLKREFGDYNWISAFSSPIIYLNDTSLARANISKDVIKRRIREHLATNPNVYYVADLENLFNDPIPSNLKEMIVNAIPPSIEGDMVLLYKPNVFQSKRGAYKESSYTYNTHIPLLWYGMGIQKNDDCNNYNITDIAPTVCALLNIHEPRGCSGSIINNVINSTKFKNGSK